MSEPTAGHPADLSTELEDPSLSAPQVAAETEYDDDNPLEAGPETALSW